MAGHRPLTPEQIAALVEAYERTGNYQAAGDAVGVSRSTAHDAIKRVTDVRRRTLNARATDAAIRRARKHLRNGVDLVGGLLDSERTAGPGLEPQHVAALINALSRATDTLLHVQERGDRRRQSALTRRKTRAEIAALESTKDRPGGGVTPNELDALERTIRALRAAEPEPAAGPGGAPD